MIGAYTRRSTRSKLIISLTYLLLVTLVFNRDGIWSKSKHVDHLIRLLGVNGQDEGDCDYEFSIWEEEEEHGEDCNDDECNGSCLFMGYGSETSRCKTEEICCCNYDNAPTPESLPGLEPDDFGSDDLTPTDGTTPVPCEDTTMEDQELCVHATCGQACQQMGFVLEVSVCYITGACCCNNQQPCHRLVLLQPSNSLKFSQHLPLKVMI